jgi:hypothetical protein
VRGSHRGLPLEFRRDRRYTDDEVDAAFGDRIVDLTGARGTVFLADTRGLHRGRSLIAGDRLVFQLEYATSLYGQVYTTPSITNPTAELAAAATARPGVYRRLRIR